MATKFQVLKSVAKYAGSVHGLKIALNLSTDILEQKILDTNNPDILDFYIAEMYDSVHFTAEEVKSFYESFTQYIHLFPRLSSLVGKLYPPKPDKVELPKPKTKPVYYLGLSESLKQQFSQQGFIIKSTGDTITGEYAVRVLSLLWEDDSIIWPTNYRQHGYLLPIKIDIRPDSERIYTTEKLDFSEYQKLDPSIKLELKNLKLVKNNSGVISIPKLRSNLELESQGKDFSSETPLFTLGNVAYYQSFIDKPIYTTNPVTIMSKNKGAIISNGFKSSVKQKLLKPLLGNDGLIVENLLDIEYPNFSVSKPLNSASKYATRRKGPRKTTVKSKISWGTKFIPTVESLEIALCGIVRLPNRDTRDKLLITPMGEINLISDGKVVGKIGRFDFKARESYWLPGLPDTWVRSAIDKGSPLDRALFELLEGATKRTSKNIDRITIDYAIEGQHKGKINGLTKRELQRLKQNARKYFLNHDNPEVLPLEVRRAVDKLNDPASSKLQREIANRNLVSYYLTIKG